MEAGGAVILRTTSVDSWETRKSKTQPQTNPLRSYILCRNFNIITKTSISGSESSYRSLLWKSALEGFFFFPQLFVWFSLKYAIYLMMLMFMSNGKAVKCLDEIPWNCSHVKETELHPFSLLLHPEAGVVLVLLKPHTLWCNHGGNHNDCASTVIWFLVHYITARARCQWIPWISTKNKQKKRLRD